MQDFNVDAMEKFVEEASVPVLTIFNKDPVNHPFVNKFFNNLNAKVKFFLSAVFVVYIFLLTVASCCSCILTKSTVFCVDVN